jgi:hypothetical protein
MNHSNYLHKRIRIPAATREAHDRAFLRTLIILGIICLLAIAYDRAFGQDKSEADKPAQATAQAPASVSPSAAVAKGIYAPTADQAKDLRLAQLEAINAQTNWNAAAMRLPEYQTFQSAVNAIYAVCAKIKSDNKLPADVGCNINVNPITFEKIPAQTQVQTQPATPTPTPTKKPETKKP